MGNVKLTELLRLFYQAGLEHLPVVDVSSDREEENVLLGFVSRDRLNLVMTDLERVRGSFETIPEELLVVDDPTDEILQYLKKQSSIPVINIYGKQVTSWDSSQLLEATADFTRRLKEDTRTGESQNAIPSEAGSPSGEWLSRLILSNFPHPLFAADLSGNTIFYNEAFESQVLNSAPLKRSIRLAESFLLEKTRSLLAHTIMNQSSSSEDNGVLLQTSVKELEMDLQITTLFADSGAVGYLYIFYNSDGRWWMEGLLQRVLEGEALTEILDDIESELIYHILEKYGQNISHSAKALGLRRSTLQNRIKTLEMDQRYDRKIDGPIRRKRRTKEEILTEELRGEIKSAAAPEQIKENKIKPSKKSTKKMVEKKSKKTPTQKKSSRKKSTKN